MADAFADMTQRIESQAEREQRQVADHREMMASVAHDLRTPLTALHGHLEALAGEAAPDAARAARVLQAALAQSHKVSRLSQQLFELAALQSTDQVLHRERFSLDDLVTDAVQKFELIDGTAARHLAWRATGPPGARRRSAVDRTRTHQPDRQRACGMRPATVPVRVSLRRDGAQAEIVVEDDGAGPAGGTAQRLDQGQSLRDPPLKRTQRRHRRPGPGDRATRGRAARRQPAAAARAAWRHAPVPGVAAGLTRSIA